MTLQGQKNWKAHKGKENCSYHFTCIEIFCRNVVLINLLELVVTIYSSRFLWHRAGENEAKTESGCDLWGRWSGIFSSKGVWNVVYLGSVWNQRGPAWAKSKQLGPLRQTPPQGDHTPYIPSLCTLHHLRGTWKGWYNLVSSHKEIILCPIPYNRWPNQGR